MYESDITKFMKKYMAEHPEEVESQKKGRLIWWDKRPDQRSPVPSMRHAPRSGGNEHTFMAPGGAEYTFKEDDNSEK
jgi:hypothetical protein